MLLHETVYLPKARSKSHPILALKSFHTFVMAMEQKIKLINGPASE